MNIPIENPIIISEAPPEVIPVAVAQKKPEENNKDNQYLKRNSK